MSIKLLARVPAGWDHPTEKDKHLINMLEYVPTTKPLHTLAGHALGSRPSRLEAKWLFERAYEIQFQLPRQFLGFVESGPWNKSALIPVALGSA